ncbi:mannitol dehydrogenase family protein [Allonocardiopsis opalescens]|uniref:Fructuronate reductase n=1 Tax=Allonocardiopsis opalescens TaxID=1144618 RepID=A0A2T0PX96_9ACTN|nr:mannitol dehydrogenase family protein [Allonocardiopsis opalescens]PRX96151.1 fructuronate reductase [Allonocardiopsis opalescens]
MTAAPRLDRRTLAATHPWVARSLPRPDVGVGIVHLGAGAFHRAHQAVFTQLAMEAEPGDWAICAVSPRGRGTVERLRRQDGLFTVLERHRGEDQVRLVGAVRDALAARDEPERLDALIAAPSTHVVTLTVTEAGYRHDPATGRLAGDDPDTAADLAGRPPHTALGQLVSGLLARSRGEGAPLTVVCCDNLPDNGRLLRRLVADYCARLPPGTGGPLDAWIGASVRFPSTVVDQIVPATTPRDLAAVADAIQLTDEAAVVAEPHRRWIIEDDFAGPRPAWDAVGVELVDAIGPHQAAKLRLVNGGHSALAYLGTLLGLRTVAEAACHPALRRYLRALLIGELGAGLRPLGTEPAAHQVDALLDRFANPRIEHRLAQIAADGPVKLPQRLLEPGRELLAAGQEPRLLAVALAAWVRLLHARPELLGEPDARTAAICREVAGLDGPHAVVDAVARRVPGLGPDGSGADLRGLVAEALARLAADGPLATLEAAAD